MGCRACNGPRVLTILGPVSLKCNIKLIGNYSDFSFFIDTTIWLTKEKTHPIELRSHNDISNLITYEGSLFYVTNLFYKKIMYLFAYPYDEQIHTSTAVVESGRRT